MAAATMDRVSTCLLHAMAATDVHTVHVLYIRPAVRIYNNTNISHNIMYEVYALLKRTILQQNQNRSETRTNKI